MSPRAAVAGRLAGCVTGLALLAGGGCSRAKELARAGSSSAPSSNPFVWPLEPQVDAGEHVAPRKGMVWIPAGTLVAGTPKDRTPRIAEEELPGREFELHGFYVDEFAYP